MKRQILLFLFALVGLTAWAENYGVTIGNVAVTSSNYTNISASGGFPAVTSGTVTYDPDTRTLTLSNAVISISGGYSGIAFSSNTEGFNLVLPEGTLNMITANGGPCLTTMAPLTISGGGTAVIKSTGHCGIFGIYGSSSDYTLTIENSTVLASGRWGIVADNGSYGTLNIKNSIISATGTAGSVCDWKALTLTGTTLYQPNGATWNETSHAVCDAGGTMVTTTISYLPKNANGSGSSGTSSSLIGDMDHNGILSIADVTALVDKVLNGISEEEDLSGEIDGHGYVDLRLPSGTLWATCNIGADSPIGYGDFFAWGETTTKDTYNGSTYQLCNGSTLNLTKYCYNSSYGYNGFTDTLKELELSDDAAYVNWGPNWRMPSKEQCNELLNSRYTTCLNVTLNGIKGLQITSKINGNSIFLPKSGIREESSIKYRGSNCAYWSLSLALSYPTMAHALSNSYTYTIEQGRADGRSIRPVRRQ